MNKLSEVSVAILWIASMVIAGIFGYVAHGSEKDVIVDKSEIFCDWETELYDGEVCVSRTDHAAHTGG